MPSAEESQDIHEQIREVTQLLEAIAQDRTLLLDLPEEDRTRLMKVAGEIYCPDVKQRRRLLKAKIKARKKEKISRDQEILNETGIRTLRSKPVFTTPTSSRRANSNNRKSPIRSSVRWWIRRTATSANRTTSRFITSTINSAQVAPNSISANALRRPISVVASLCSQAVA